MSQSDELDSKGFFACSNLACVSGLFCNLLALFPFAGNDDGLHEMTYAEWLEVIARLANVQYPEETSLENQLGRWFTRVFQETTNASLVRRRSMFALERKASMALPGSN